MMYKDLYRYLLIYKELSVPGIGTFLLERKPANIDFPNKKVEAPGYSVSLTTDSLAVLPVFFERLAPILNTTTSTAVIKFNDFVFDLKKKLGDGATVIWDHVGTLNKNLSGIIFIPSPIEMPETSVSAIKVLRENQEHSVRVGEDQRTSTQMVQFFRDKEVKGSYWWAYALVAALLAFVYIGWHFSKHGIDATSGNKVIHAGKTSEPTYRVLQ